MTADDWRRVKAIVFEAGRHDAATRSAFVARACAGRDDLRLEVLSLLDAMARAEHQFERTPLDVSAAARSTVHAALRSAVGDVDAGGRRVGPYTLQRELGRGGMGVVYLASRTDGEFAHDVALKIIKRGMDTDAVVRRFRTERQILADLTHPQIARLLDGGTTEDGRPYLVMEYVDGQPITTYADAQRLDVAARLQLFCKVCAAVAYAHQHLVVHRDIKPSNVLVAASGEPKLLDFGLAKILDVDGGALDTDTGHRWLTPEFASPEQLRGDRVTTASDVYALGVLLYELLSGERPFGRRAARGTELVRAICDDDPEKPSAAAATDGAATAAAARATRPDRLQRVLRGDLDRIVLKALEKDPARRYASAQSLSDDVQRYLAGQPVSASGDAVAYHVAKFLRRHTAAVTAAAAVAVTLIAATGVTVAQARVARRERAQAERRFKDVRRLANSFLFDFHDAIALLPGATTAREMVLKTAQEYLAGLAQEAGNDRELWSELSTAYLKLGDVQGRPSASRLGDTDGAVASYTQALALRRRLAAADPTNAALEHEVAIALFRIGPIYQVRGEPSRAIAVTREAMAITDRLLERASGPEIRRSAFRAPLYLGDALLDAGDYDASRAMFEKALRVAQLARNDPPEADFRHRIAVARERLGIVATIAGDPAAALASFREAFANEEAMLASAPDNAEYVRMVANGHYYVGDALRALGRRPEAIGEERRALEMYESLLRADPRNASPKKDVGGCAEKLAEILVAAGAHRDARKFLEQAAAIRRELADRDKGSIEYVDDLAETLTLWGESLLALRDPSASILRLDEARRIREPIVASRREQAGYARGLARSYTILGAAYAAHAAAAPNRVAALERWRTASEYDSRALDIWNDLRRRHALWASEAAYPDAVARHLAAVDRAVAAR